MSSRPTPTARAFAHRGDQRAFVSTVVNRWNTVSVFAAQNTSPDWANLTVEIFDDGGAPIYSYAYTLAPWASRHVDVRSLIGREFSGSAVVRSDRATVAVATVELSTANQQAKGLESFPRGSRTVYMSTALCRAFADRHTTFYAIQNTGTSPTSVEITFQDRSSSSTYTTFAGPIPPGGKASVSGCAPPPPGFQGSAVIRALDFRTDAGVVAIGKAADEVQGNATGLLGVPAGGPTVVLPYVRWSPSASLPRTFIAVQNVSPNVHAATITFYDRSGASRGSLTVAIDPLKKWSVSYADLRPSEDFDGSAILTSGTNEGNLNVLARTQNVDDAGRMAKEDYNGVGGLMKEVPGDYVGLGDSFASGEGVAPYLQGSDEAGPPPNRCHRSTRAYPELLFGADFTASVLEPGEGFWACSGATTRTLMETGQYGEPAPIQRVTADAGLVTLSIGGNDSHFGEVVADCAHPTHTECIARWDAIVRDRIRALQGDDPDHSAPGVRRLRDIYVDAAGRAPDAQVRVVSYPALFQIPGESSLCSPLTTRGVTYREANWMDQMGAILNAAIRSEVDLARAQVGDRLQLVDVGPAFSGHGVCGSDSFVNAVTLANLDGSFHPNERGHRAVRDLVKNSLLLWR